MNRSEQPPAPRRGRRAGETSSRETILAAARAEFAAVGFRRATVRRIAAAAGVDPAMINHHFGGKDGLFSATLALPFVPAAEIARAAGGPPDQLAERLLGRLLELWDLSAGAIGTSVLRTALERDEVLAALRDSVGAALTRAVPRPAGDARPPAEVAEDARWRSSLVAAQLVGLIMGRYLIGFAPLDAMPRERVVAAMAPALQRLLTGVLD